MRISIESKELMKALPVATSMAGRDRTLPILDCVKCQVKGLTMRMISFNNEIAVCRRVALLTSDADVSFCINARDFLAYAKTMKGEVTVLDIHDDLKSCSFVLDKGELTLPLLPVEDFPTLTNEERPKGFVIGAPLFREWMAIASGFVGSDKLRPVTANLWIYVDEGKIGCCASDSFKMFLDETSANSEWEKMEMLVQNTAFKVIADACVEADFASIKVGEKTYTVNVGATSILCRKVEYRYPDVRKVVPPTFEHTVSVDVAELTDTTERAMLTADMKTRLLKVKISDGSMTVTSEDVMNAKRNLETLLCDASCNKEFGIQGENLLRCLNTASGNTVSLSFNEGERSPIVIKGSEDETRRLLAMPLVAR